MEMRAKMVEATTHPTACRRSATYLLYRLALHGQGFIESKFFICRTFKIEKTNRNLWHGKRESYVRKALGKGIP
jgi:hypothetical protein